MAYLAVAVGGFLGACARYLLTELMGTLHGFPLATLLINWSGSFALAWFYAITMERVPVHPHLRAGIGTGFIGAFTTFSTIQVESWSLWLHGERGIALTYLGLTYIGGVLLAIAGYVIATRQSQLPVGREKEGAT